MSHQFTIADVFTTTAFGGNQLAVFTDARGLSDRAMQALARELNFSESTFVFPAKDPAHTRRVRIFTPRAEVPFAGHPTVGTAAVLVQRGLVPLSGDTTRLVLEENVGPIDVEVTRRNGTLRSRFTVTRAAEQPAEQPSVTAAAATLSLPVQAVLDTWFASVGLPFCFIRLDSKADVDRAILDRAAWTANFSRAWSPHLFLFAGDTKSGSTLHARMFGPAAGVDEDPATGSASATLGAVLADRLPDREGSFSWHIDQGVAMGRPSAIEVSADKRGGRVTAVHVAGGTIVVAEGSMEVPAGL